MSSNSKKIGLVALITVIISSSIGSGVFGLAKDLAIGASPGAAFIGWLLVGVGVVTLALSFNNLSVKCPHIDSGVAGYAQAAFGKFSGFICGWGYWISAWLGNVALATILMSTIGYFIPLFKGEQNVPALLVVSFILWGLTYLVSRGVESATLINTVVTVCKLIPLFVFVLIAFFAFKINIFTEDFFGNVASNVSFGVGSIRSVVTQVKSSMVTLMWAFVGIEGASLLSSRAKRQSDVGKATVIGVLGLLVIYIFASMLPYGVMSRSELATLDQPAMAYVLKEIVGPWGAAFISIGIIISILGAWLAWTMLPAETVMIMAREGVLPRSWGKLNKNRSPETALIITAVMSQFFLITLMFNDYAYAFAFSLCTSTVLICYLFVSVYQVKYTLHNRNGKGATKQLTIGIVAILFQLWALYAAGLSYILLMSTSYLPGVFLYIKARKENRVEVFVGKEKIVALIIFVGAFVAVVLLLTGQVKI